MGHTVTAVVAPGEVEDTAVVMVEEAVEEPVAEVEVLAEVQEEEVDAVEEDNQLFAVYVSARILLAQSIKTF